MEPPNESGPSTLLSRNLTFFQWKWKLSNHQNDDPNDIQSYTYVMSFSATYLLTCWEMVFFATKWHSAYSSGWLMTLLQPYEACRMPETRFASRVKKNILLTAPSNTHLTKVWRDCFALHLLIKKKKDRQAQPIDDGR